MDCHNGGITVNNLQITELYSLYAWIVCYVIYIPVKCFKDLNTWPWKVEQKYTLGKLVPATHLFENWLWVPNPCLELI
jgi:hypothetical protein